MLSISQRVRHLTVLATLLFSLQAQAFTEEQHQSVIKLGELNGIALQCGQFDETRRMKKALIDGLPKLRALGQLFEDATHKSFVAFSEQGKTCPTPASLGQDIDAAISELNRAYSNTSQ